MYSGTTLKKPDAPTAEQLTAHAQNIAAAAENKAYYVNAVHRVREFLNKCPDLDKHLEGQNPNVQLTLQIEGATLCLNSKHAPYRDIMVDVLDLIENLNTIHIQSLIENK